MELERFAEREADRVLAQIRGDVANPQALSGSRFAARLRTQSAAVRGPANDRLAVAVGSGQQEQRIVGKAGQRHRRHRIQHLAGRHIGLFSQHRPFALALAQRRPVLTGLRLIRLQFDRLPQRGFRLLVQPGAFENASHLLQRHGAIVDPLRRDVGTRIHKAAPLRNGLICEPTFFQRPAEVYVRGSELRIEFQAVAQRLHRAADVVVLPAGHRIIEARQMQQRIGVVEGNPGLVEIGDERRETGAAQAFRNLHQLGERQLLAPRALEDPSERRSLIRSNGLVECHERPAARRPAIQACNDS